MDYKKILILIFFIFYSNNIHSKILYDKDDLIITSIDINAYMTFYENTYGVKINTNVALKDLVLINNLIKNLERDNKEFLKQIDDAISIQYQNINYNDNNLINFLRFSKIRNEFIIDYFRNVLSSEEIENIFSKLDKLSLPLSNNNCLIIEKVVDLKSNKNFIENFFNNLRNNTNNFEIIFDGKKYNVCIDKENFRYIEQLIVNYIQNKTEKDFEYFVYDKTRN